MPSNRDRARSGLRARRVRRALMDAISEYSRIFATRLVSEIWVQAESKSITLGFQEDSLVEEDRKSLPSLLFPALSKPLSWFPPYSVHQWEAEKESSSSLFRENFTAYLLEPLDKKNSFSHIATPMNIGSHTSFPFSCHQLSPSTLEFGLTFRDLER